MPKQTPVPFQIPAGVSKVESDETVPGRWVDMDMVRFVRNKPEKLQGWRERNATTIPGIARAVFNWQDTAGVRYTAVGSHKKVYIYEDNSDAPIDITPLRTSGTLTNPFSTTSGSPIVSVAHTSHGLSVGDYVHFSGASAVGGITISGEYTVTAVTNANVYTITHTSNASSTAGPGGGASVAYEYEVPVGIVDAYADTSSWGEGVWGGGVWGGSAGTSGVGEPRIWTFDLFGSKLLANYAGGTIYEWTPGTSIRMTALSGAPSSVRTFFVTGDRFITALGTTDALTLSWPSQGSSTDWTPTTTNTANTRRVQGGTRLMAGARLTGGNILWTDTTLFSHQFTGSSFVFDTRTVADQCGLAGPKGFCVVGGVAYWMANDNFLRFSGYVEPVPRVEEIRHWLFNRISTDQKSKSWCFWNAPFNEVWWFYPRSAAQEPTDYVFVDLIDFNWSVGVLSRSAGQSFPVGDTRPILVGGDQTECQLYLHEAGYDNVGAAIDAWIQTSATDIEDGEEWYTVTSFVPDFFEQTGDVEITLNTWDRSDRGTMQDTATETSSDEEEMVDFDKLTGRSIELKLRSNAIGGNFRLGTPKLYVVAGRGRRR